MNIMLGDLTPEQYAQIAKSNAESSNIASAAAEAAGIKQAQAQAAAMDNAALTAANYAAGGYVPPARASNTLPLIAAGVAVYLLLKGH
jgi:hypothetical protein